MTRGWQPPLNGHALAFEGAPVFDTDGHAAASRKPRSELHAKCSCGQLSEPGITRNDARRWHRDHQDAIRTAYAPRGAA